MVFYSATTDANIDYNLYVDGGGVRAWNWYTNDIPYANFSTWQSDIGGETHSLTAGSSGLSSLGVPLAGSAVIGAGANLTNVGIPTLNADKNSVARPSTGAWDIGAYEYVSTGPTAIMTGGVAAGAVIQ